MTAEIKSKDPKPSAYHAADALLLFYYLCDAYHKGVFTFREFSSALNALRFIDINKDIWTIGAKTGKWYRLKGKEWVIGQPISLLTSVDEMLWYEHIKKMEAPKQNLCGKCGAELYDDSTFCSKCGAPVSTTEKTARTVTQGKIFCRKCGSQIKPESKFCTKCGTPRR